MEEFVISLYCLVCFNPHHVKRSEDEVNGHGEEQHKQGQRRWVRRVPVAELIRH